MDRKKTGIYLLVAELFFLLFPELTEAGIFALQKHSLPGWCPVLCSLAGALFGMAALYPALCTGVADRLFHRETLRAYLKGIGPVLFFWVLTDSVVRINGILFGSADRGLEIAVRAAALAVPVVGAVGAGYSFGSLAARVWGRRISPLQLLRRPLSGLGLLLAAGTPVFLDDVVLSAVSAFPEVLSAGIFRRFLLLLLAALVRALLLTAAVRLTLRLTDGTDAQKEEGTPGKDRPPVRVWLSGAGLAVLLAVQGVLLLWNGTPDARMRSAIDACVTDADHRLIAGDLSGAVESLQRAKRTVDVFAAVLQMDGYDGVWSEQETGGDGWSCYWKCASSGTTAELERYLRLYDADAETALALVDLYEGRELTKEQELCRKEAAALCLQEGTYVPEWLRPDDIEGNRERMILTLRGYEDIDQTLQVFAMLLGTLAETDVVTPEQAKQVLRQADQYPDQWMIQYLAAYCAGKCRVDGADHYGNVIAAAVRFEELYRKEKNPEGSELAQLELLTAELILPCYGYEEALPYLKEADKAGASEEAYPMLVQCYDALGMNEECYECSLAVLEQDKASVEALYYAAVSALKLGEPDEALRQTKALAALAQQDIGEEHAADVALYAMLQYLILDDNAAYTEYQYAIGGELTQEQQRILEEDPFLKHYYQAVYDCFRSRENGHLQKAEEEIAWVLERQESLPQAWYLKGAILYAQEDFEGSVQAYRNSLELRGQSATVWYALANALDAQKEYQSAYDACMRALELLPQQDHGEDWYGISIHAGQLAEALKKEMGED